MGAGLQNIGAIRWFLEVQAMGVRTQRAIPTIAGNAGVGRKIDGYDRIRFLIASSCVSNTCAAVCLLDSAAPSLRRMKALVA